MEESPFSSGPVTGEKFGYGPGIGGHAFREAAKHQTVLPEPPPTKLDWGQEQKPDVMANAELDAVRQTREASQRVATPAPALGWENWDSLNTRVAEIDDPDLAAFATLNRDLDVDVELMNGAVRWMRSEVTKPMFNQEQLADIDRDSTEEVRAELAALWQGDLDGNLALINSYLNSQGQVGELFHRMRTDDGRPILNNGALLQRLLGKAK